MTIPRNPLGKSSLTSLLREFWSAIDQGAAPLATLQAWAEKCPTLTPARNPHAVRREHNQQRIKSRWVGRLCFACHEAASQEHHIVQIQHGGTNRRENKVWICTPCHRLVHPQMALPPATVPSGSVPYFAGTERLIKCPGCGCDVLSVQPQFKKRKYPMAQSTRAILLQPTSQPPYRTTDLHPQHCLNKRGLSQWIGADLRQMAKRDIRWAEGVAAGDYIG